MVCPYCGSEMEVGVIQSPHEIAWMKKKYIFARGGMHKGSVVLSRLSAFKGSAVSAHLCRKCQKVIIDYADEQSDLNR